MDSRAVRTRRARELALVLSALALGAIFAAVGGLVPGGTLPEYTSLVSIIPHLNAGLSVIALVTIGLGYRFIRNGDIRRHRAAMVTAFAVFAAFLVLYLYKVAVAGTTQFPGPDAIYSTVYLPVLAIHILLAIICVPLLFYVLSLARLHPVSDIPATDHPRVGRVAVVLWAVSFALGLVVYALLYLVY
jgi:putative membrane protein